jgi:hypothetical protein
MSEARRVVAGITGIIEGAAKKGESLERSSRRLAKEVERKAKPFFTLVEVRWLKNTAKKGKG